MFFPFTNSQEEQLMVAHERVQLITLGQLKELAAALVQAIPLDLDSGVAQAWIGGHARLQEILRGGPVSDISTPVADFQRFYRNFLGMDVDFSNVRIPERKPGFDRLILIPQGLTPNHVYKALERHGIKCWLYADDLDGALDWSQEERNPQNGSYAIWVRDRQEADEELKNLSADDIKAKGFTTETLTERLIHEAKCYSETREHLDQNNITLCSGSRVGDGGVPDVVWDGGSLSVFWCSPVSSDGDLRSRQTVS